MTKNGFVWKGKSISELRELREQLLIMWKDICEHKREVEELRLRIRRLQSDQLKKTKELNIQTKEYDILMRKTLDLPTR